MQHGFAETDGEKLKTLNLLTGDQNGDLLEDQNLTRAELATILCQINKVFNEAKTFSADGGFIDVQSESWFSGYVNYCSSRGWLKGVGNNRFDPYGQVSEEMVATVLLRLLGYNPIWGEATFMCKSMGIKPFVSDSDVIKRGEVFSYVYSTLQKNVNETKSSLASQIGIQLNTTTLVGRTADNNSFYTVNGIIKDEKAFFGNQLDGAGIINIKGNYYHISDDVKTTESIAYQEYGTYIFHEFSSGQNSKKGYYLLSSDEFLVMDDHYKVVGKGELPNGNGFDVSYISNNFIIFSGQGSDEDKSFVMDFSGNTLLGTQNTTASQYITIMEMHDGRYFTYRLTKYDENGIKSVLEGLYDAVEKQSVISPRVNQTIVKDHSDYAIYTLEQSKTSKVTLINLKTKATVVMAQDIPTSSIIDWKGDYPIIRGLVGKDPSTGDNIYKSIAYDYQFKPIIIDSAYTSYEHLKGDYYIYSVINNSKVLKGVINKSGKIIIDAQYIDVVYYPTEKQFHVIGSKEQRVYDENFKLLNKIDKVNDRSKISKEFLLPNGYKLYITDNMDYILKNESDQTIKEFINGYVTFDYDMELILFTQYSGQDTTTNAYDIKGLIIDEFKSYEKLYITQNGKLVGIIGKKTYIFNNDLAVEYGPFDQEIYFNVSP